MRTHLTLLLTIASLLIGFAIGLNYAAEPPATEPAADIFARRILPILKSDNPSSCTECHLAGVALKDYILPTSELTFLSLRDQGLINLDAPEKSRILQFIQMKPKSPSAGTALIDPKMREAEFNAFAQWIITCAKEPALRAAPKLKPAELATPQRPVEVIRHARQDAVLASFERNIWSQRFRCFACHAEGGSDNAKLLKQNPNVTWLQKTPEATLDRLLFLKDIDTKQPLQSELLTKPAMLVKHEGGKKMEIGDDGYKAFRTFLEDYAATVSNTYAKATDLPAESRVDRFGSDLWLKIDQTPAAWGDKLSDVQLFAWDAQTNAWEKSPIAVADRAVFGKGKLWQDNLILLADKGSPRAKTFTTRPALPPGRYLLKVYIDTEGKLAKDWRATFTDADFAGQIEFQSKWPPGYGQMTTVNGTNIKP